mmetsp:Transcript_71945/g.83600  ORF Transcript_71945/g.83600 Transcript_71945/m.83600 type:complete len:289 (-) Transcript_71945:204-1070(-)
MQDRILELKKHAVEEAVVEEVSAGELSDKFTKKVQFVQDAIGTIKTNNERVLTLKKQYAETTQNKKEQIVTSELGGIITENNVILEKVKDQMTVLGNEVEKSKENLPNEPETRMKSMTYQALTTKFQEVLKETQKCQVEFKTIVKDKVGRQAKIISDDITDEQVNELCENPEGVSKLLKDRMIGPGHIKLQNTVSDIQDKYRDIKKLEESVNIVHQMFVDMAMLVHHQGEMIDNIEINMKTANNYVEKANVQLNKAKKSHIAARKKMCFILLCLAIILFIILMAIFVR